MKLNPATYLLIAFGKHGLKILHCRQAQIKLVPVMLRKGRQPQVVMSEDVALGGTKLVEDKVEEGGLAGTIGADDTWREGGNSVHLETNTEDAPSPNDLGRHHILTLPPSLPILVSRSTPKSTFSNNIFPISTGGLNSIGTGTGGTTTSPSSFPSSPPPSPSAGYFFIFFPSSSSMEAPGSRLGYPKDTLSMLMTGRPRGSGVGRWKRNWASSSGASTTSSFSRALMRDWTRAARLALYLGGGGGGRLWDIASYCMIRNQHVSETPSLLSHSRSLSVSIPAFPPIYLNLSMKSWMCARFAMFASYNLRWFLIFSIRTASNVS